MMGGDAHALEEVLVATKPVSLRYPFLLLYLESTWTLLCSFTHAVFYFSAGMYVHYFLIKALLLRFYTFVGFYLLLGYAIWSIHCELEDLWFTLWLPGMIFPVFRMLTYKWGWSIWDTKPSFNHFNMWSMFSRKGTSFIGGGLSHGGRLQLMYQQSRHSSIFVTPVWFIDSLLFVFCFT